MDAFLIAFGLLVWFAVNLAVLDLARRHWCEAWATYVSKETAATLGVWAVLTLLGLASMAGLVRVLIEIRYQLFGPG